MKRTLDINILPQPNDTACGPTCLHAIYRYFEAEIPLGDVVGSITTYDDGGTLAVHLAIDALRRGYQATLYTYNLHVFDPTWHQLSRKKLDAKLAEQEKVKNDPKLTFATEAYRTFLSLGGELMFEDLTPSLIRRYVKRGIPAIVGLSSTYLYQSIRERPEDNEDDDIGGYPAGHFVVIHGYNLMRRTVSVADPLHDNPADLGGRYEVKLTRLVCAILLGVITYDANMLIIEPNNEGDL